MLMLEPSPNMLSGDRMQEENDGEVFLPTESDVLEIITSNLETTAPTETTSESGDLQLSQ